MPFTLRQPATIRDALRQSTTFLKSRGIEDARQATEWILSHELGGARLDLYQRYSEILPTEKCRTLQQYVSRLADGEPLQYVLGEAEFMGHVFKVDRRCLIPRPETERLVEWVIEFTPLWALHRPAIVDVGTGSGCIVISLALAHPEGHYEATDFSADILSLARENAARYGVLEHIRFSVAHLLTDRPPRSLDAVIANPPYVRTADWTQLSHSVRDYEPRVALDGGPDGLGVIRPLMAQAVSVLKPGGWLFMEIGEDQWPEIQALSEPAGFCETHVRQDLAGKNRLVMAQR